MEDMKNAKRLLLLLILLNFLNCEEQERDCKKFYTGSFYSETVINGKILRSTFRRDDTNIQIEEFNQDIDSSRVRWVNDCEMVLSSISPKNINEKKNILIKILETTDSSYTYEYSYVGESVKLKSEAFKIK